MPYTDIKMNGWTDYYEQKQKKKKKLLKWGETVGFYFLTSYKRF